MSRVNVVLNMKNRLLCEVWLKESQQVNRSGGHSLADVLPGQDQATGLTPEAADVPLFL